MYKKNNMSKTNMIYLYIKKIISIDTLLQYLSDHILI